MTHEHEHPQAASHRLDAALAALPRDVPPGRDLWAGIQPQLEPRAAATPSERRRWVWQLAAAVALVAISSLVTATLLRRDDITAAARPPAGDATAVHAMPASFGPGHALNPDYEQARRQLTAMLQQRIDHLPPAARSKLEDNLAQLRRAAHEINDALDQQPGDPLLEELLLSTYQEELAVLAAANQLTAAGGAGPGTDSSRMQL